MKKVVTHPCQRTYANFYHNFFFSAVKYFENTVYEFVDRCGSIVYLKKQLFGNYLKKDFE